MDVDAAIGDNRAPVFKFRDGFWAYSKIVTTENTEITVTYPARDADKDTLTYSLTVNPQHGEASVDAVSGAITYKPETGFTGKDSLTVAVEDGRGGKDTESIPVTVVDDALVRVACVGDSLTYGAGSTSNSNRYPDQVAEKMGSEYWFENFGLPATTLTMKTSYPYPGTTFYENSLKWNPHIVILMLGTNDATTGAARREGFQGEYEAMIRAYQELPSKPVVFVVAAPPAPATDTQKALETYVWPAVKEAAKNTGATLIDLPSKISLDEDLFFDTVHLNDAGYKIFADTVYESVSKLSKSDLPGYQTPSPSTVPGDPNTGSQNPSTQVPGDSGSSASKSDGVSPLFWALPVLALLVAGGMIGVVLLHNKKK